MTCCSCPGHSDILAVWSLVASFIRNPRAHIRPYQYSILQTRGIHYLIQKSTRHNFGQHDLHVLHFDYTISVLWQGSFIIRVYFDDVELHTNVVISSMNNPDDSFSLPVQSIMDAFELLKRDVRRACYTQVGDAARIQEEIEGCERMRAMIDLVCQPILHC